MKLQRLNSATLDHHQMNEGMQSIKHFKNVKHENTQKHKIRKALKA